MREAGGKSRVGAIQVKRGSYGGNNVDGEV